MKSCLGLSQLGPQLGIVYLQQHLAFDDVLPLLKLDRPDLA